jgi:hypothetical protein
VGVGTEGGHLGWVIGTALGQVVDMVDFQERVAGVGEVAGLPVQEGLSRLPWLRKSTARRTGHFERLSDDQAII